jgi:hypothetical protein
MVEMTYNKAFSRVLHKWKYAFIIAIIVYFSVFIWAFTFEVQREEEGLELEEPLELFSVTGSPRVTTGANVYTINITNDQDYTIEELTIEFRNVQTTKLEDFSATYEGNVNTGSSVSHTNRVEPGAVGLDIELIDTEIVGGFIDIDLFLNKEGSSSSWESATAGTSEEIHLTQSQLEGAGFGNYIAEVRHSGGARDVDYELTYNIQYGEPVLVKGSSQALEPGDSNEFTFNFNFDQSDVSNLECVISGVVDFGEGLTLNIEVILDASWNVISFTTPVPEDVVDDVPWGPVDLTGTSGVVLYTLTIITGLIFYLRIKLHEDFSLKTTGWVHCFLSLMATMVVGAHMSTALQKWWNWPWGSVGMMSAVSGFVLLIAFTIFSLFDVEFIKSMGRTKWRWIHLLLTLGLLLVIVIHFGLMGDHLGFLK